MHGSGPSLCEQSTHRTVDWLGAAGTVTVTSNSDGTLWTKTFEIVIPG